MGFHDLNEKLFRSQQAPSMGVGTKVDFCRNGKCVPGPDAYFPQNLCTGHLKKGFSMGLSRDLVRSKGLGEVLKMSAGKPGPGQYDPTPVKSGRCVTLHWRPRTPADAMSAVGPGAHVLPPFLELGRRVFNSRVPGVASPKYPPFEQSRRPLLSRTQSAKSSPSFACDTKHQINAKGVFFNSRFRNSGCRIWDREERLRPPKPTGVPGPGAYVLPSEFGVYRSSKAL